MNYSLAMENSILRKLLEQTTRAYEEKLSELHAEKELAQVTLASIAEGVVTCSLESRITYVNPVAESLTGRTCSEALDRPLAEVVSLLHEATGEPLALTTEECLRIGAQTNRAPGLLLVRSDGKKFPIEMSAAPVRDRSGSVIGGVLVFRDVSEKRLMQLQLVHEATHDALTGMLNRKAFDGHLQRALMESWASGATHALCYLDIDQFKLVNDTAGHLAGDELLRAITSTMQDQIGDVTLLARLGGDEFALLLENVSFEQAKSFGEDVLEILRRFRFDWHDKTFDVTASIGLVPISGAFTSVDQLLSAADHACYIAKEKGRNRLQVYQSDDAELLRRHSEMTWVIRIEEMLAMGSFTLFAQRIDSLSSAVAPQMRFEVLLRVVEADGSILLPGDVIRAAERYGLMAKIDRWVIEETLATLALEPELLQQIDFCSINLSALSLGDESFLPFVREAFERHAIPPGKVCFEITETAAMANLSLARELMRELTAIGCRFALDDFGAGMSSFSYLRELPVHYLKIDGKFINDIVADPYDRAMVETIRELAAIMGIETIAEAVTSGAILEGLRAIGVDYAQGFWLNMPGPIGELVCRDLSAR